MLWAGSLVFQGSTLSKVARPGYANRLKETPIVVFGILRQHWSPYAHIEVRVDIAVSGFWVVRIGFGKAFHPVKHLVCGQEEEAAPMENGIDIARPIELDVFDAIFPIVCNL